MHSTTDSQCVMDNSSSVWGFRALTSVLMSPRHFNYCGEPQTKGCPRFSTSCSTIFCGCWAPTSLALHFLKAAPNCCAQHGRHRRCCISSPCQHETFHIMIQSWTWRHRDSFNDLSLVFSNCCLRRVWWSPKLVHEDVLGQCRWGHSNKCTITYTIIYSTCDVIDVFKNPRKLWPVMNWQIVGLELLELWYGM